jgi:hypothetical protein
MVGIELDGFALMKLAKIMLYAAMMRTADHVKRCMRIVYYLHSLS